MNCRGQIASFSHVDVQSENGEVIGLVLFAADEDGSVEWALSRDAARQFLRAVGAVPQAEVQDEFS